MLQVRAYLVTRTLFIEGDIWTDTFKHLIKADNNY